MVHTTTKGQMMGLYGGQRYTVIIDPRSGPAYGGQYYVSDNTKRKIAKIGPRNEPLIANHFRVEYGGARVSQYYYLVDTAVEHAKQLNLRDMWAPCPMCTTPSNCDAYRNCDRANRLVAQELGYG